MSLLEELAPLFRVDWLLPRTILAGLRVDHLGTILHWVKMPPEALLAMVFYHINSRSIHPADIQVCLFIFSGKREHQHPLHKAVADLQEGMRAVYPSPF